MRPKEKAKEIINKHYSNLVDFLTHYQAYKLAKQCALICVDEILDNRISNNSELEYFQEVIKEIEKL
tara:strand:- start:329 stop:529 length:201 start_codon:yes stop_codon:yes gene_type:complete